MKIEQNKFDKSILTEFEYKLLEEFQLRREMYNEDMEKSKIIYNKHTCPGCGFPALNGKSDYETCIICLWEDCGLDDKTDTLICPPNYQSLVEHRINITRFFREFTLKNGWQITTEQLIRNIKAFELDIKEGKVNLDSDSFENNLKKIVFRV